MITPSDLLKEQYALVQVSRGILFDYCKTISSRDFTNENSSFGRGGSMRNLLVHIANCYQHWVANIALNKNLPRLEYDIYKTIEDVIKLFNAVDGFMLAFIENMENFDTEIEYEIYGVRNTVKLFELFSHVITHEYHHKGQILSISRHLGYIPVDTDILR